MISFRQYSGAIGSLANTVAIVLWRGTMVCLTFAMRTPSVRIPSALLIAGCSCFDFAFDARTLRRCRLGRHRENALSLNAHISQSSEASLILAFSVSFVEKNRGTCRVPATFHSLNVHSAPLPSSGDRFPFDRGTRQNPKGTQHIAWTSIVICAKIHPGRGRINGMGRGRISKNESIC